MGTAKIIQIEKYKLEEKTMLVSMKEILDRANQENYAVAAPVVQTEFNARTAIKCAEELNAPIILLVPLIFDYDVDLFGRYLKELAQSATVPVAINHDHGSDFPSAVECIRAGFSSIMVDRSELPFEENIAQVKELVKVAHAVGVSVEAELGHVGNASNYDTDRDAALTEPELAKKLGSRYRLPKELILFCNDLVYDKCP